MVTGPTVNSTFVLRVKDHNRTEFQCVSSNRVGQVQESFRPTIRTDTTEPQGLLSVNVPVPMILVTVGSLIVNIIFIVFLLIWISRKKTKPNQEKSVYMSLNKTHPSAVYEVIVQPNNDQVVDG